MFTILFDNPLIFALYAVGFVIALSVHEFAHAITADRLGDPTPRMQGRVSLNPLRHLDPMGTLFILFIGFGWGKPVMFDPYNLRNPRRDAGVISIAGPISNLILAVIGAVLFHIGQLTPAADWTLLLYPFISMNVMLAVFNLIPIHPLDGFKIVGALLPERQAREWYELERYGVIFLLLLIVPLGNGSMVSLILQPALQFILGLLLPGTGL